MESLISVIVPAYNCEKEIEACVKSILNSTYKNIEVIVVDDGSEDSTREICEKLMMFDCRVDYLYQVNQGVSVARNKGLDHAKGDYIAFVDGDDQIEKDMLECLYNNKRNADIIACSFFAVYNNEKIERHFFEGNFIAEKPEEKELLFRQLLDKYSGKKDIVTETAIGVPWGKLYRSKFLCDNKLNFDNKLRRKQDNVFNMWAFGAASKIIYIDKPLYDYNIGHIKGYSAGRVVISEINLKEILLNRERFFEMYPQYNSINVQTARMCEYLDSIASLISMGVLQSGTRKDALVRVKKICNDKFFLSRIKKFSPRRLSRKKRIFFFLYRNKQYYLIYRYFLHIKNS